ncbi:HDOD domain-containing protein [Hydrogenivirga sp. 128-5-R1-1]|uniref:EAL and HDOD domain-containing protein n=1 Tax=Hydrogenivirga sp. 128-5-R1-1 TaxID=392423 RepID=UPI00015EF6A7|nr:HDOD domain-containing protein [Hydrogenivirga sp. 128-5-R1-1]EDP73069.1 diguanylate phosphodiesterase (EAL domain) [Hydrogenivirga sp. 128-5-R1-1]
MIKGFNIAKQYIYGKNKKIEGCELFFRGEGIQDFFHATLITFNYLIENLKLNKYVFLNVDKNFIMSELPQIFEQSKKVVFELMEDIEIDSSIIDKIKKLKTKGFLFSVNNFDIIQHEDLLEFLDFAKVDIKDDERIFKNLNALKLNNIKPIAFKIENEIFYKIAQKLGFEYYQGYYFSYPEEETFNLKEENQKLILKLINGVVKQEPINKIEEYFKLSPKLVTGLLIYINSAYFGFRSKIDSLKRAISILGYKNLEKWLFFQLFYSNKNLTLLLEKASFRGKLLEFITEDITSD